MVAIADGKGYEWVCHRRRDMFKLPTDQAQNEDVSKTQLSSISVELGRYTRGELLLTVVDICAKSSNGRFSSLFLCILRVALGRKVRSLMEKRI